MMMRSSAVSRYYNCHKARFKNFGGFLQAWSQPIGVIFSGANLISVITSGAEWAMGLHGDPEVARGPTGRKGAKGTLDPEEALGSRGGTGVARGHIATLS
jgi:hypothetical protein